MGNVVDILVIAVLLRRLLGPRCALDRLQYAHGGAVTVESTVGVGTTFMVELPRQSRSPFDSTIEEVAT